MGEFLRQADDLVLADGNDFNGISRLVVERVVLNVVADQRLRELPSTAGGRRGRKGRSDGRGEGEGRGKRGRGEEEERGKNGERREGEN